MFSVINIDLTHLILVAISIFAIIPLCIQNEKVRISTLIMFISTVVYLCIKNFIVVKYPEILLLMISGLLIYILANVKNKVLWFIFYIINFGIMYAIFSGFVVPFDRVILAGNVKLSALSGYYSIGLNLGKVILGYLLVYFFVSNNEKILIPEKLQISALANYYVVLTILLIGAGLYVGYLRFDPKLPGIILLWMFNMLFFVCIPEEIFFRRYVLKNLESLNSSEAWKILALIISSVIFGLAHYYKGYTFVVLSMVAGLFYGRIYQKTNSISHAIYLHFLLNLTHFLFFTYP